MTNGFINTWKGLQNDAEFVSQDMPTTMTPGQVATVTVTMKNSGTTTWSGKAGFTLGSQSPQDNNIWSTSRIYITDGINVMPGTNSTFTFVITAPTTPGTYNFQWQTLQEHFGWFGEKGMVKSIVVR